MEWCIIICTCTRYLYTLKTSIFFSVTEKSHFKIACNLCSYMYLSENIRKNIEKKCFVSGEWDAFHSLSSCLWLQKVWFCLNKRTWNTYAWFSTDYYCIVKIDLFLRQRLTRRRYCNCMFSALKIKTFWELCIYIIDFFFLGGGVMYIHYS